jgi:hypothetical protein
MAHVSDEVVHKVSDKASDKVSDKASDTYSKGYIERMTEPLCLVPVIQTPEQKKAWEEKYGPILSREERMEQYIIKTAAPHNKKL